MTTDTSNRFYLLILTILLLGFSRSTSAQLDIILQTGNKGKVEKIELHPTKNIFLSLDSENNILFWDLQLRKQYSSQKFEDKVKDVCFINDSLYAIAFGNKVEIWNFTRDNLVKSHTTKNNIKQLQRTNQQSVTYLSDKIYQLNIYSDESKVVFDDQYIEFFNYSENDQILGVIKPGIIEIFKENKIPLLKIKKQANYLHVSSTYNYVAVCTDRASVLSYDLNKKKSTAFIGNTRNWNKYSVVDFFGEYGIAGDDQDIITIFKLKNGRIVSKFKNKSGAIHSLDLDINRNILIVGGENGIINYYNLETQQYETSFSSISPIVESIHFADNERVILGYENGIIKSWDFKLHEVKTVEYKRNKMDDLRHRKYTVFVDWENHAKILRTQQSLFSNNGYKTTVFDTRFSFDEPYFKLDKLKDEDLPKNKLEGLKISNSNGNNKYYTSSGEQVNLESGQLFICSAISPDQKTILASASNGFLYLIDKNSGDIKLKMCSPTSDSFFYMDNENYYFASKNSLQFLAARYQNELIGFEQIDLYYNRPDRVLSNFSFFDQKYISLLHQAFEKRMQKLGIEANESAQLNNLPEVQSNLSDIPLQTKKREWEVEVSASSSQIALKSLHILVNGVPMNGKDGIPLSGMDQKKNLIVQLSSGQNKIQIYVENDAGLKSVRKEVTTTLKLNTKTDLYVLSIGSGKFQDENFNLNYAEKDASEILTTLNSADIYNNIYQQSILGKNATKENVFSAIDNLKEAKIDDVILIFFAGHGVLSHDLDYYLSTYDMDFSNPEENGIPFEELENRLGALKCRHKTLFIDACHSGELDKEEVSTTQVDNITDQKEDEELIEFRSGTSSIGLVGGKSIFELSKNLFVDLRTNNGVVIISSAGAAEYALEGSEWKNGAFTYCILNGLNNLKADLNKDREVSLNELQEYLFKAVPELTDGKQTPTSRVEILEQDYRIW